MPNVAGVQFPYTPQGVQAAQLYQRSLSPRRGLGFRPIRMDDGGSADGPDIYFEFLDVLRDGDAASLKAWLGKVGNLEELMFSLSEHEKKTDDTNRRKQIEDALKFAADVPPDALIEEVSGGAPFDQDSSLGPVFHGGFTPPEKEYFERAYDVDRLRRDVGTGSHLYGPSPPSEQFDDSPRTMAPFRPAEQINVAGSDIERPRKGNPTAGYRDIFGPTGITQSGTRVRDFGRETAADILSDDIRLSGQRNEPMPWNWRYGDPEGMAHGGVPRGTVAGELEPRGYLTARQAGETMRERAKGLRDRRNYGGGIGSLYNRYG